MTRMTMVAVEDNGGLPWTLVASHQFDFVLGDDFPVQFGPGREAAGASVDGEDARVVLVHLAVEHVGDGAVDALVVVDGHQEGHQSVGRRVLQHLVHLFLLPIVLVQDRDLIDVRVGPAKVGSAVPGRDAQLHLLLPILLLPILLLPILLLPILLFSKMGSWSLTWMRKKASFFNNAVEEFLSFNFILIRKANHAHVEFRLRKMDSGLCSSRGRYL